MTATTIFPLAVWASGTNQNSIPANDNALRMQALLDEALTIANSAPSTPADNDQHIVGTAWSGLTSDSIVIYKSGTWYEFAPVEGMFKTIGGVLYQFLGGDWAVYGGASSRNDTAALSIASGVVDIDWTDGDYQTLALTANVTSITFSNLPGSGKAATLMVRITQDSTARTVAWPASFKWADGTPGTVSTGSGAVDILAITSFDNGTTWFATLAKAFA
jgi:Protein of unknown function (DUF2793)